MAMTHKIFKNRNVRRIYSILRNISSRISISFVWIPAHVGIQGNEKVDELAKTALSRAEDSNHLIPWSDLKQEVDNYLNVQWQREWDDEVANKLHEVLPNLKERLSSGADRSNRKQETVLSRLRIGHTWLTNGYLLKKEDQPWCVACDSPYTVRHILVECSDFQDTRKKFFDTNNMYRLFREVSTSKIIDYVKELGIHGKI